MLKIELGLHRSGYSELDLVLMPDLKNENNSRFSVQNLNINFEPERLSQNLSDQLIQPRGGGVSKEGIIDNSLTT